MKSRFIVAAVFAIVIASGGRMLAHHGVSAYDVLNPVTIKGTVTEFVLQNPHSMLFLDVKDHLDERGLPGFLERCVERGLFAAPGPSFGPYPTHLRVCFTAAPPDVVERGVEVLAGLLGR